MRWMEKTGLGMILDAAGDYALTQGALKGAGKLKGLLTGGGQAAAPVAAKALPEGVTEVGRMASASPAEARSLTAQMVQPKPMPAAGAGTTTVAPRPMQAMVAPPATAPAIRPTPVPTGMTPQMTKTAGQMGGMQNVANANITRGPGLGRSILQGAKEYAPLIQATAGPGSLCRPRSPRASPRWPRHTIRTPWRGAPSKPLGWRRKRLIDGRPRKSVGAWRRGNRYRRSLSPSSTPLRLLGSPFQRRRRWHPQPRRQRQCRRHCLSLSR